MSARANLIANPLRQNGINVTIVMNYSNNDIKYSPGFSIRSKSCSLGTIGWLYTRTTTITLTNCINNMERLIKTSSKVMFIPNNGTNSRPSREIDCTTQNGKRRKYFKKKEEDD